MPERVCLQPCLGANTVETTIGRQACYLVHEQLREGKTDLGCAPALYAGVEEDVEFIMNDAVLAVESCDKGCANTLVRERGGTVDATILVEDVLREANVSVEGLPREHLDLDHPAVKAVAERIAEKVDELLAGG